MTEGVVGAQEALLVGDGLEVFVEHLLGIDDGADLQEIELAGTVVVEVAGKLDLHGALHLVGT